MNRAEPRFEPPVKSVKPPVFQSLLLIPLKTWIWWATAILYYLTLFNCIYRENLPSGEERGNFTGSFYRGTFDRIQ